MHKFCKTMFWVFLKKSEVKLILQMHINDVSEHDSSSMLIKII